MPIVAASAPPMLRPDKSRSIARAGPMSSGNRQEAAGANTPSFISGWPSTASGRDEYQMTGERHLEPAAEALAAHGDEHRNRRFDQPQDEPVNSLQHGRAPGRQMLLDARAEAEMRAFGIEQHRHDARVFQMLDERTVERRDHLGVDQIRLRPAQAKAQQPAFRLEPDFQRRVHGLRCPRLNALGELVGPRRVGRQRTAQRDEVDLTTGFTRAFVEGAESGTRLRHHVEREPGARILLVPVPRVELGFAQFFDRLRGAIGERVEQLGAETFDLLVEQAEIDGAAFHQLLAGFQRFTGFRLCRRRSGRIRR